MKKWIFIGVGALLLVVIAVVGTLFATGAFSDPPPVAAEAMPGEEGEGMPVAPPEPPPLPVVVTATEVFYHYIQPEFIVNFRGRERPRTLMVEITVSSYVEDSLELLSKHSPELRNNLLLVMAEKKGTELTTLEGKNQLREEVKDSLNQLMKKHSGIMAIDDVYFTRFVLQ
ncbi:MAG: flagellar basal body-associated FliL family protein [Granulosicoccus sp.]|nr:flagellar basal body-associated FliL family protein [Granulosicoccus sp.]